MKNGPNELWFRKWMWSCQIFCGTSLTQMTYSTYLTVHKTPSWLKGVRVCCIVVPFRSIIAFLKTWSDTNAQSPITYADMFTSCGPFQCLMFFSATFGDNDVILSLGGSLRRTHIRTDSTRTCLRRPVVHATVYCTVPYVWCSFLQLWEITTSSFP